MKTIRRFFIFNLILAQVLIAGCSVPHIGTFMEVHGAPHIVQNNVCYFMGPWGPGAVVLKINYKDLGKSHSPRYFYTGEPYHEQVTSIEWEYIGEDKLHFYIPLLIESLKDTSQGGKGMHALRFLYSVLSMGVPRDHLIKNTPIDSISEFEWLRSNPFPEVYEETYTKWKHWWDTKAHKYYDPEIFKDSHGIY